MTLLEILEKRALETPEKIAFTFHQNPPCTYGKLWKEISRCGSYLIQTGIKTGDPVIIAIPNSIQFFYAFYGVQWAGGIAVPVFPGSGSERIIKLANLCSAAFIVISRTYPPSNPEELSQTAQKNHLQLLLSEHKQTESNHQHTIKNGAIIKNFCGGPGGSFFKKRPLVAEGKTAFIQFTSGSIGDPKGVQLTHANLITNVEQMITGMEITTKETFVSWLPVYHDMGLILMTMVPFYLGIELILLPTGLNYLKTWLKTIQDRGATFTAAPDFAYRSCLLYIRDPENYDLSSLRVALNAAEMVRSSTIGRFEQRFKLKNVILPAYGLAEATVGVSSWKPGKKIKVDSRGFVSIGKPFPGVLMRISRDRQPANPGEIGEILIKSDAGTSGYFRNPRASKELFDNEGFIKTGDLGYIDNDGDYFIVGREKNIIIQAGINIASGEIEELIDEFSFVRRSAAVGIDRGGSEGEQVYIFIEVNLKKSRLQEAETFREITFEVVQQFNHMFGFKPGRVYLLKTGAIPMTYNGKIKYLRLKEDFMNGALRKGGLILFPEY